MYCTDLIAVFIIIWHVNVDLLDFVEKNLFY